MSDTIYELEQQILSCWGVIDEVKLVTKHFVDDPKWKGSMDAEVQDAIMKKYSAIQELYELKFQKTWNTFEQMSSEYRMKRFL